MLTLLTATLLTICAPGPRDNCVHDGDTWWQGGQKYRVTDIDTPELNGKCAAERALAIRARDRFRQLLNAGPYELVRSGRDKDRNGRLLRIVTRNGRSLGDQLVREGLARTWSGRREPWC
jgi:endonuclease YncB( thermonuclease family)